MTVSADPTFVSGWLQFVIASGGAWQDRYFQTHKVCSLQVHGIILRPQRPRYLLLNNSLSPALKIAGCWNSHYNHSTVHLGSGKQRGGKQGLFMNEALAVLTNGFRILHIQEVIGVRCWDSEEVKTSLKKNSSVKKRIHPPAESQSRKLLIMPGFNDLL